LFDPDATVELRAPTATKAATVSGYFDPDHRKEMARAARDWSGNASGIYFTLNPVRPDLIARANNRAKPFARDTTKDSEVLRRVWLPMDFDPKRPAGISATEAEHQAALGRASECRDFLRQQGWPDPVSADSGNGAHLLYQIELPNEPESTDLIKQILDSLASRFTDAAVDVDRTVYNAARIFKLYGTLAAKGDPTPERPHRIARILEAPDRVTVVPVEALKALAARPTPSVPKDKTRDEFFREMTRPGGDTFDLERWINEKGLPVAGEKGWEGGSLYVLNPCPWNPDHTNGAAFVGRRANGALFAGCHHNGCAEKGWPDLREVFEPGWRAAPSRDGCKPGEGAKQAIESIDDPHRLARLFLESSCQSAGGWTLRSYGGRWLRWDGIAYSDLPEVELNAELVSRVKQEFDRHSIESGKAARKVTNSLLANVRLALGGQLLVPVSQKLPCWTGNAPWPSREVLPARNGLFHLPSLAAGVENQIAPTPTFLSTFALDYDIVPNPGPPTKWLKFLDQLWPDKADCVATLQEFMGYYLTLDTSQQKILLMVGPPRCGKGTISKVMSGLVGERNVTWPTSSGLKTNFGLQSLVGKSLAILADAQLNRHDDTVVERLKNISGEDETTVDRKYADPLNVKLTTRLVILSNDLPRLKDPSGALANRFVILRFTVDFVGREDTTLLAQLLEERSGILAWAIEGWKRLGTRGRFIQPESGRPLFEELQDLGSPVGQFVRECCRVGDPLDKVSRDKLYELYKTWCLASGHNYPLSPNVFGAELRSVIPGLGDVRTKSGGKRVRYYRGVGVKA
jgi:putative DNA primase/helicase